VEPDVDTVHKETYTSAGVSEGDGVQHSAVKEIKKEYYRRVHMVLMTE